MKLLYLNPYGGNFGDEMGVDIARRLCDKRIRVKDLAIEKRFLGRSWVRRPGVMALGSILHYSRSGDVVWGTGINPFWQRKVRLEWDPQTLDIRAVRGPLTAEYLNEEYGLDLPLSPVYGDPGMLVARLFPELGQGETARKYGITPHYLDMETVQDHEDVMPPNRAWRDLVEFILGCEMIVSSSLHALIVAEAFKVPARWWHNENLPSSKTEGKFKYNDYYASTDRSLDDFSETIEGAVRRGGKEPIKSFDFEKLESSFPRELF